MQPPVNVWDQRSMGIFSPDTALDSISDEDIEYICNYIYPFLQIINTNSMFGEEQTVNCIIASTGWVIHDYGEAISVSAPHTMEGRERWSSIVEQAKTVEEIANLIAKKGWNSVELNAGTPIMRRFIWMESKKINFTLNGYAPSEEDERAYARLAEHAKEMGINWKHATIKVEPVTGAAAAS